jgi:hypothetical protein
MLELEASRSSLDSGCADSNRVVCNYMKLPHYFISRNSPTRDMRREHGSTSGKSRFLVDSERSGGEAEVTRGSGTGDHSASGRRREHQAHRQESLGLIARRSALSYEFGVRRPRQKRGTVSRDRCVRHTHRPPGTGGVWRRMVPHREPTLGFTGGYQQVQPFLKTPGQWPDAAGDWR